MRKWIDGVAGWLIAVAFIAIGIGVLSPSYNGQSFESDAWANSCTAGGTLSGKICLEKGICNVSSSHTIKIAIYNTNANYDSTTATYTATSEWAGAGYSAGGYALTNVAFSNAGGNSYASFDALNPGNVTANAASTCAIVYDSSASNTSLWIVTYTSMQPTGGPFTTGAWTNALGYQ